MLLDDVECAVMSVETKGATTGTLQLWQVCKIFTGCLRQAIEQFLRHTRNVYAVLWLLASERPAAFSLC